MLEVWRGTPAPYRMLPLVLSRILGARNQTSLP